MGKGVFVLFIFSIAGFFIFINLVSASVKNISLDYPLVMNYSEVYIFNLTLINATSDIYDVKIDIFNNTNANQRISRIWNGSSWESTIYYVTNAINTSNSNNSIFLLNITDIYNGSVNISVTLRNSAGTTYSFKGFFAAIFYFNNTPQNTISDKNISLSYPLNVNYGCVFSASLTLFNFPPNIYSIKMHITDMSGGGIAEIFNGTTWRSGVYWLYNQTNTSISNSTLFYVNVTEKYNGMGNIEVKIKNSSDYESVFSGFQINITYNPVVQNTTNPIINNSNQNTSNTPVKSSLEIEDLGEIYSNKEEKISVKFYNLNGSYDLKLGAYNEDEKLMSEIYNDNEEKWQSSNYYIKKAVSANGSENEDFKIRFKKEYSNFTGTVYIEGKIRKTGTSTIIDTEKIDVDARIKENLEQENNESSQDAKKKNIMTGESIININNQEKEVVYESKLTKILKYLGTAAAVLIIVGILIWFIKI